MEITLNEVEYEYRQRSQTVRAVRGVSTTFVSGRFYAIMGKSGSGKTTLLSLMAGLMMPTAGEIRVDGRALAAEDSNRFRRETAAVIYQDFNLFPLLTVEENAAYPLELRKVPRREALKRAREALASVGIAPEQFRRRPSMLSGGEQQRVAIARALTGGHGLVLADEPTGSLDTGNTQNIVEILTRLAHEEGRCVIVVTHDPAIGEQADVAHTMSDGRFAEGA